MGPVRVFPEREKGIKCSYEGLVRKVQDDKLAGHNDAIPANMMEHYKDFEEIIR